MSVDLAHFSRVVALIHEAGATPERWTEALAAIVRLVQGSRASLMEIDSNSGALLALDHVGHDPSNAKTYAEYYYAIDPTRALAMSAPAFKAMTVCEEFPAPARARHEYFDFATRIDIGDVMGAGTLPAKGRRSLVSVQRSVGAAAYVEEEKKLFELLASHIALAKRVQMELGEAGAASARLEAAFGKLSVATLLVDRDARVRHLNAAATELMARHPHIAYRSGKLAFADAKLNSAFLAALRDAATTPGRAAALRVPLGRQAGEVLVAPLDPAHRLAADWQIPLALVMLAGPARDEKSIAWRMRQLYGLTPAESRVAALLALGASVDEIAKDKHLSDATLRAHLRSIFSKTGTRRQAELDQLALRGAALRHDL
jgi:DNA-binding CsgD family transcriptional regulator